MNRLIAEKNNPQADVYWTNEPIRAEVLRQLPVLATVANTFSVAGKFSLSAYETLLASGKQLTLLMGRRVLLSVSVTFAAMVVGVPLGVLPVYR